MGAVAADLRAEARAIAWYLTRARVPDALIERYVEAHGAVLLPGPEPVDHVLLALIPRHQWMLAYLDAALSLLRPGSLLRGKMMVMLAILETCPELAQRFLPQRRSRAALFLNLVGLGLSAGAHVLVGLGVYAALKTAALWRGRQAG